ncbi:L-threonylcarbamoyladenylate synthase [Dermatobacter hominis]|uniref:L-threonylcarbamoyladenylate synthase n=1 Tax=Dermatobacter hominis TaxID=2884263 RepID=UPI001D10D357|nr:L-threonylcarbamoyladenylate synthase [Dermatobacter hominis]UDY37033.1 threonylcarbamoyl-AMP synthase [Dermatobacter hominis]
MGDTSEPGRASAPEVVELDALRPDAAVLDELAGRLAEGLLVAFPTETVYGLGAAVDRPAALRRIFAVKGRPPTDPLIVHVAHVDALDGIVDAVPVRARDLAAAFWPGPLTMVLPRGPLVGDEVTAGGPSVGVRVPAHPVAQGLIRALGTGIAAPSANRFGRISPTTAQDVVAELGPWLAAGDAVADGGPTPLGIESTVVDLTGGRPTVLRHGGVPVEDLEEVLGDVDAPERRVVADDEASASPGALLRHYAPDTPLALVEGDRALVDELVGALGQLGLAARVLDLPADPYDAAADLYRALRAADGGAEDLLLAVAMAPAGLGRGINDRLFRAAHGRVVTDASPETVDRLVSAARAWRP